MKLRRKIYSGVAEANPAGSSYVSSGQVMNSSGSIYILDSADNIIDTIDNSRIGNVKSVKRKLNIFKRAIHPTKEYLIYRRNNKNDH